MLAERGGQRAVIWCKLYQSAVGNKAVQEAYLAMTHYSADCATVITSCGSTPSARRLSAATGVVLLLHSEVKRFNELLAQRAAGRGAGPGSGERHERTCDVERDRADWLGIMNTRTGPSMMRGVMLASS